MNPFEILPNQIEFVVTQTCTGRCANCSEEKHPSCGAHIDERAAVRAIHELCGRYDIQSLMIFGGEPLLFPETACAIFRAAASEHIPKIDLITNGFFSCNSARIDEVAAMLAESGVKRVLLSDDAFNAETMIPIEPVKRFIERLKAFGMTLLLNDMWTIGPWHDNPICPGAWVVIGDFAAHGVPACSGNISFLSRNAMEFLDDYFSNSPLYNIDRHKPEPSDVQPVRIAPNGDALGGNILRESILDILERYKP